MQRAARRDMDARIPCMGLREREPPRMLCAPAESPLHGRSQLCAWRRIEEGQTLGWQAIKGARDVGVLCEHGATQKGGSSKG